MKSEGKLITFVSWIIAAFLFGASFVAGTKTVNYLWPEKKEEIIVKHQWEYQPTKKGK